LVLPGTERGLIVPGLSDVGRLAEEFCPIVLSSPLTKEERRERLAGQKTHPRPQLAAQDPVEPVLTEDMSITVLRPGESHKIYHSRDILGSVSKEYALVVERAAHWCGVGDEVIYAVVERFERRFLRWKKKRDKLEKELVGSDSGFEDSEEAEQ